MSDTSGRTSLRQFAYYDPESSSWKTWPAISLWGLDEYSETWPRRGTTQNGRAYERLTSAQHTDATASSSLLKTPTAQLATNGGSQHPDKRKSGGHGPTLADEVEHLLPTPTTSEDRGPGPLDGPRNDTLRAQVLLLPTPRATDGTKGGPNQRRSSGDLMLPSAVSQMGDGAPMDPPSPAGNESPDEQLQIPASPPPEVDSG